VGEDLILSNLQRSLGSIPTMSLTPDDLQDILAFTVGIARKAGNLILEGSAAIQAAESETDVGEKKNAVDLVTEYDIRVEELVKTELSSKYPTFGL
jgi:myo-inositol-1(or 4)-monophosphatase